MRHLLNITNLYKFTGHELFELRKAHKSHDHVFSILPKWVLTEHKRFQLAEFYLQFSIMDNHDSEYILFDIDSTDDLVAHEISNSGVDDFLAGHDWNSMLGSFEPYTCDDFKNHTLSEGHFIVIELEYKGDETEIDDIIIKPIGFLDKKMELILFS